MSLIRQLRQQRRRQPQLDIVVIDRRYRLPLPCEFQPLRLGQRVYFATSEQYVRIDSIPHGLSAAGRLLSSRVTMMRVKNVSLNARRRYRSPTHKTRLRSAFDL